jgi:hypothetical protein
MLNKTPAVKRLLGRGQGNRVNAAEAGCRPVSWGESLHPIVLRPPPRYLQPADRPSTVPPANFALPPSASSIRSISFHFAMRSPRVKLPTFN